MGKKSTFFLNSTLLTRIHILPAGKRFSRLIIFAYNMMHVSRCAENSWNGDRSGQRAVVTTLAGKNHP